MRKYEVMYILRSDLDQDAIKAEVEAKGWAVELGVVQRTGACGAMDSIYLRDPDGNLIEISVYRI